jgi:hypothetical protein
LLHTDPRFLSARNHDLDVPPCGSNVKNTPCDFDVVREAALTEILGQMSIESEDVRRVRTRWTIVVLLKRRKITSKSRERIDCLPIQKVLTVKTARNFLVEPEGMEGKGT